MSVKEILEQYKTIAVVGLSNQPWRASYSVSQYMQNAGYRTGAVVANAGSLNHRLGWGQGFTFYSDEPGCMFGYEPSLNGALQPWPLPHARPFLIEWDDLAWRCPAWPAIG